jgi:hypothetical protein
MSSASHRRSKLFFCSAKRPFSSAQFIQRQFCPQNLYSKNATSACLYKNPNGSVVYGLNRPKWRVAPLVFRLSSLSLRRTGRSQWARSEECVPLHHRFRHHMLVALFAALEADESDRQGKAKTAIGRVLLLLQWRSLLNVGAQGNVNFHAGAESDNIRRAVRSRDRHRTLC